MPAHQRVRLDNCHRLENRREPSIKLQEEEPIAIRKLDATTQLALQNAHLLPQRGILGFKPKLRLEWQEQQSQQEDEQPDHYRATVSNFGARSRRMRFSVHTGGLFRCETILLHSHWVMVVMDVFTRRIIGFGVERADLCGVSICRMFNQIVAGTSLPQHLSSDHDPLFRFHRWRANLRILEVDEIKSIPYVPVSHPFVERLIGTVRREFLDHVLVWNSVDLTRKLEEFRSYYNDNRVHQSLNGRTPGERSGQPPPTHAVLDRYAWRHHCRGLFQMPIAA
jgi:Integrase core domain